MQSLNDNLKAIFLQRLYAQNERVVKLGLDAMRTALGEGLQSTWPLILVAGTNGKGQVSQQISIFLQKCGYRVGLFTSPHLVDYRERIRVNGKKIDEYSLLRYGSELLAKYGGDKLAKELEEFLKSEGVNPAASSITLTYYELSLAIAQAYFKAQNVQFGVYEIGLGGKLDACNALEPMLSVISSISRDHCQYLGNELDAIAREKAGIMRPHKPVVIGRDAVKALQGEAKAVGCSSINVLDQHFGWQDLGSTWSINLGEFSLMLSNEVLPANYQRDNAAVALAAIARLSKELNANWDLRAFADCIQKSTWFGRFTQLGQDIAARYACKSIILDAAHNEAGAKALVATLKRLYEGKNLALVVGACGDKDLETVFDIYRELLKDDAIFVAPVNNNPRVLKPDAYCARVSLPRSQGNSCFLEALQRAALFVGKSGIVVVTGSIYLLGEAMQKLGLSAESFDNI
ncbi:MAG: cyanophycin synthetase [Bradymonadales bacterium]|jgi:dihydrofolate synthase/folylpolyglutamate synthase